MTQTSWTLVLGFEIHVELATKSKMFCGCNADHFGKPANTQTCPVCLGLPGALPVPNKQAIDWCIQMGQALNCSINLRSKFDRKNYFYPDLPKGYQISQYDEPFCVGGFLVLPSGKKINITRVHMEEDTGKLAHVGNKTQIDFNRSGVPLVEIVTEPDFTDPEVGTEFLKEVQAIIRTLGISTADMEKGSMRLEANISVRPSTSQELPKYKVEVKNVNSFRFIKKAIEFEVKRQTELLEKGETPKQETRGFNENLGETVSQRSKENANDYRYFPEPDIPPFEFTQQKIDQLKASLPELPQSKRSRLVSLGISSSVAATIVATPGRLSKFEQLASLHKSDYKQIADLVANSPEEALVNIEYVKKQLVTDSNILKPLITSALAANPKAVTDYKAGKEQALFAIVGVVRKQQPDADVASVLELIKAEIS